MVGIGLYTVFRGLAAITGELRSVAFAPVQAFQERYACQQTRVWMAQRHLTTAPNAFPPLHRTIALATFVHLQRLSLRFHLQRKTGGVIRSVSRGATR